MKLKSLHEGPVSVALLSGHTILIPPEGRDVPKMFVSEALRCGCVPVGVDDSDLQQVDDAPQGQDRGEIITSGIKAMLAADCNLTGAGLPNLKDLSKQVGFTVTREELLASWALLEAEALGSAPGTT